MCLSCLGCLSRSAGAFSGSGLLTVQSLALLRPCGVSVGAAPGPARSPLPQPGSQVEGRARAGPAALGYAHPPGSPPVFGGGLVWGRGMPQGHTHLRGSVWDPRGGPGSPGHAHPPGSQPGWRRWAGPGAGPAARHTHLRGPPAAAPPRAAGGCGAGRTATSPSRACRSRTACRGSWRSAPAAERKSRSRQDPGEARKPPALRPPGAPAKTRRPAPCARGRSSAGRRITRQEGREAEPRAFCTRPRSRTPLTCTGWSRVLVLPTPSTVVTAAPCSEQRGVRQAQAG